MTTVKQTYMSTVIEDNKIFLQVQHEGSKRLHNRLTNLVKDKRKASIIFHNEFQKYASCEREQGETLSDWQTRYLIE